MLENTSFVDTVSIVNWGSNASQSSRDPKIVGYNPKTRQEMREIASFAAAARVVYWGSQGIEILPEPKIVGNKT